MSTAVIAPQRTGTVEVDGRPIYFEYFGDGTRLFAELDANLPGYRAIRTPTLILAGEHDRVIPPHVQRKIGSILPDARFEVLPDAGHVVYLERPSEFFPRLRGFISGASRGESGDS